MNYDDFSLPKNWEGIAKAYSQSLKNKGFVFVRIDEDQNKKFSLAKQSHDLLTQALIIYKQAITKARGRQKNLLEKTLFITENTINQIKKFYNITTQGQDGFTKLTMFNLLPIIVSSEAKIIKNLLLLLEQEDHEEKHAIIKNSLFSRLEILEDLN